MVSVKINGGPAIAVPDDEQSLAAGETGSITELALVWTAGNPYKFDIYDSSGQVVGAYQATPPQ
jgi:hypothetical protein